MVAVYLMSLRTFRQRLLFDHSLLIIDHSLWPPAYPGHGRTPQMKSGTQIAAISSSQPTFA